MKVRDLIEALNDADPNGEAEVRLMTQPSWPFEWSIAGTWTPGPSCAHCGGRISLEESQDPADEPWIHDDGGSWSHFAEPPEDMETFTPEGDPKSVVYILEGSQLGYGAKAAWEGE
jgi:hypothetical protein